MSRKLIVGALVGLGMAIMAAGLWIPAKAVLAQVLLERAWTVHQQTGEEAKPWPWADTSPIAELSAPQLDTSWIILKGSSGQAMAFAPSMMDPSLLPAGVTLIGAHRDTHFRGLEKVNLGDIFTLDDGKGAAASYRVLETMIVHKDQVFLERSSGEDLMLLVTCYPFDAVVPGGPMRFVVLTEKIIETV